ncbi:MAG: hypothetical protein ACFBSC_13155 [Microcoleaceae cyanobacterium]
MSDSNPTINTILVPQGLEYQAVLRGLKQANSNPNIAKPRVIPIPIGSLGLVEFLQHWLNTTPYPIGNTLVIGLCGGLSSEIKSGDIAVYQNCVREYSSQPPEINNQSLNIWQKECDPGLTQAIYRQLNQAQGDVKELRYQKKGTSRFANDTLHQVTGLTSNSVICSAQQKHQLQQAYQADVVDMEGAIVLEQLGSLDIPIVMVRVVSDDSHQDLPDLNPAIDQTGTLRTLPLSIALLRNPRATVYLIKSAIQGLRDLRKVSIALFID